MSFKDHFSRQAAAYGRFRPRYPDLLIDHVASLAPDRRLAIDCAAGSGQATIPLADRFEFVLALDASLSQLRQAGSHPAMHRVAALAEQLPVATASASLVAVAQALHWFDFERFHQECRRVLVPGGVLAVWTYETFSIEPEVDRLTARFYHGTLGTYWPDERRHVEDGYRSIPFPWRELPAPQFALEEDWQLDEFLGYVSSWSAVQRYRDANHDDPLAALHAALERLWPPGTRKRVRWPIQLRLGRR
ncbi:MAG TPA: class I SAM-dependent methyltransferase [Steroidobacteraceae bacterium]|nr:class I SAM-dependent methyltransferase [Steroidobacteraceae bacterium]